ncbi:MAG: alpha/beta fold hydrolase [Pirellulales bacterium]
MNSVKISTTTLAYVDQGRGTPILLVHGFPLDHTMWDAQIAALSSSFRVLAPDLRGFGQSPLGQANPKSGITMEQYADDLAEFVAALSISEPFVLAGFSMGGYISWPFVRKHAGRLRGLVLCDTRAAADNDEGRAGRIKMADNVAEWGSGRVAEIMGPRLFSPRTFENRPDLIATVRKVVERTPPAAIAAAQRGMAARPDVRGMLPKIAVPTLVIVGAEDVISTRDEMKSIAAAIPNAKFVEIPAAGHMTTMENPEAVNAALAEFLTHI